MLIGGLLKRDRPLARIGTVDVELRSLDFIRRICHGLLSFAFILNRPCIVPSFCMTGIKHDGRHGAIPPESIQTAVAHQNCSSLATPNTAWNRSQ